MVSVRLEAGLLTVDSRNAPLADVLRAIGEKAGFAVTVRGEPGPPVSASLVEVPLQVGVKRLVDDAAAVMLYDGSGGLREVRLYGAPGTATVAPAQTATMMIPPGQPAVTAGSPAGGAARSQLESSILQNLARPGRAAQTRAWQQLSDMEPPAAIDLLARTLRGDVDPVLRRQAAAALGRIGGEGAAAALEPALRDGDGAVRVQALRALGLIQGETATRIQGEALLHHPDAELRSMAAQALGERRGEMARGFLERAASDPDPAVRAAAQQSLADWQ